MDKYFRQISLRKADCAGEDYRFEFRTIHSKNLTTQKSLTVENLSNLLESELKAIDIFAKIISFEAILNYLKGKLTRT